MPTTSPHPDANPSTIIRMTLVIDKLSGPSLSPSSLRYFMRWMRAGKQAKVTAARVISASGNFGERMGLYAQVRRLSQEFVVDEGGEPLETSLILMSIDPNADNTKSVVSTCDFDMGNYLTTLVDSGSRSITVSLDFPPETTASATVSIKTIGDNHLEPYSGPAPEPRRLGMRATTPRAQDADEAVAALEIERLRRQRQVEPDASALTDNTAPSTSQQPLDSSSSDPDLFTTPLMPVTATTPASFDEVPSDISSDNSALRARIQQLEEEIASEKRERKDAERKISAHVAHAHKIKETYTQLAAWYNNLRQEHIELQKKVPQSGEESDTPPRVNSNASSSAYETDLKRLEGERNSLQNQAVSVKSEVRDLQSRNSQLLETKARTLVELREQWDAAQEALRRKESESEEKGKALREVQQRLESLEAQLAEKDAMVNEKEISLSHANDKMKEMEQSHSKSLAEVQSAANQKNEQNIFSAVADLQARQVAELEEAVFKAKDAAKLEFIKEFESLRAEKDEELDRLRKQLSEEYESKKMEELSQLRAEHDRAIDRERDQSNQVIQRSKSEASELREAATGSEEQVKVLQTQLNSLKEDYEQQFQELNKNSASREESLRQEMQLVISERDLLSQKFDTERKTSTLRAEQSVSMEKERSAELAALKDECTSLRTRVASLEKENDEMRNSPRQIDAITNSDPAHEEELSKLTKEAAELRVKLRAETEKRKETASILEKSDREYDEIRGMVTRLRSERDKAQDATKHAQEELAQAQEHAAMTLSKASSRDNGKESIAGLTEARDKAILELFRVRKGMNKQIRQLQKQLQEKSSQRSIEVEQNGNSSQNDQLSEELSRAVSERDAARTDLQKVKDDLERVKSEFESEGVEREKSAQDKLSTLEAEIEAHKIQIGNLEVSLSEAMKNNDAQLHVFELEKDDLLKKMETAENTATSTSRELAKKNNEIMELTQKVKSKIENIEESEQNVALLAKERDASKNKCAALEAELIILKKSLDDVSSTTSSKDNLLRDVQKESAERLAEVMALRSELEGLHESTAETEQSLRGEVSSLRADLERVSISAESSETQIREIQSQAADYQSKLEVERALKEKKMLEKQRLSSMLEDLQSKYSSLTSKLAEEQSTRNAAQDEVSAMNGKIIELEGVVSDLNEKVAVRDNEILQIERHREEANSLASELRERLNHIEADSREQNRELKSLREKLASSESAREIMQQQVYDAGGKSQQVVEELDTLRGELEKARDELRTSSAKLDEEMAKAKVESDKSANTIAKLKQRNEGLKTECSGLHSRLERTEKEMRGKRASHTSIQAEVDGLRKRHNELEVELAERVKEVAATRDDLARAYEATDKANQKYVELVKDHEELKRHLLKMEDETIAKHDENASIVERAFELEEQVSLVEERMRSMQTDHEEQIASERANFEREVRKISEMRRELRSARDLVDSLQAQLEEKSIENEELLKEKERSKDNTEARDSVLNDLISNRLELAYAQDEIIRLRNRLKKVTPKGQGSSSFEY